MTASELAIQLYLDYDTTYICRVSLETTIENMLLDGISFEKIEDYLCDILDNIEFINKGDNNG